MGPLFQHDSPGKHCRRRKARTVFSDQQLNGLEKRFESQRYLSTPERVELASQLNLSETQVSFFLYLINYCCRFVNKVFFQLRIATLKNVHIWFLQARFVLVTLTPHYIYLSYLALSLQTKNTDGIVYKMHITRFFLTYFVTRV